MKEMYIAYAKKSFTGKALELVLSQIEAFFDDTEIEHTKKYKTGDSVVLKKGTFMHGIPTESFDWAAENGLIASDFTHDAPANKIKNSVGVWNIRENCFLRDYIIQYSGFTITYTIGRGPGSTEVSELIPYHKFDEFTERINNDEKIWMYWGESTKETRFLPSLVSDKRQIAFILNMESEYAKKLAMGDVWNTSLDAETLSPFLDFRYREKFLTERFSRSAKTTDRESAVIFGLPAKLIEGVFVGRKIENDPTALRHIKERLPGRYICGLGGTVIAE